MGWALIPPDILRPPGLGGIGEPSDSLSRRTTDCCSGRSPGSSVGVHKDWLIARLSAEAAAEALQRPGAKVMDITGRPMRGWLMIAPDGVASDESLRAWVEESVAFAGSLPPK
jgi:hypothetical protein